MAKVIREYETEYNVGDVIIFKKFNVLNVGIIEGYYVDDGNFWFNVRTTPDFVYTYSNGGDIAEWDIVGSIDGDLKEECFREITEGMED